jgi:hypothetical protein
MIRFLSFVLLLISVSAVAAPRQTQTLEASAFDSLTPDKMNQGALYYTEEILPFTEWQLQSPQESQALNLYPGFVEPTVTEIKNGISKKIVEKMMMYVVRAKLILNKAPGQIKLDNLRQIDSIRKFDPEIQQSPIQPSQIMANVIGKGQITNFDWCKDKPIQRAKRETDLGYIMPKTRGWCTDSAHSLCVESCYEFTPGYQAGVALANLARDESKRIDNGIGFQSEIRTFLTEPEAALPVALSTLTKVNTPVRGGLEQSSFYFNQLFQYAKVLAVIQDDPADPSKSVATAYFVLGIKKRTWDVSSEVGQILQGKSPMLNSGSGLTAGIPLFTQNMMKSITNILEN